MKYLSFFAWLAGSLGFGLVITGVALLSVPAAFVVAGVGLLGWAYLADRAGAARIPDAGGG